MSVSTELIREVAADLGADQALVTMALNTTVDVDAVLEAAEQSVQLTVWDTVSPINGVDASHLLSRSDYIGGPVYLLTVDGVVIQVQPHNPDSMDPLPPVPDEEMKERFRGPHVEAAKRSKLRSEVDVAIRDARQGRLKSKDRGRADGDAEASAGQVSDGSVSADGGSVSTDTTPEPGSDKVGGRDQPGPRGKRSE